MTALYRLFLSNVATRGRVIGLLALGVFPIVIGLAVGAADVSDRFRQTTILGNLGLALIAPVVTLVLASSALGDPNEDGTLVYLWLRPVARWRLTVAALAATLTVAIPIVIVPMAIAAAVSDSEQPLVGATIAACAVAVIAYTGLFTLLGLVVKRAMAWGLAYILVWEGFIARAGDGTEALSIRSHTLSVLARLADGPRRLYESSMTVAVVGPLVAAAIAAALTTRRLHDQDVA
jgi:ABC-2 type transport system permease protein